ncbi:hypothetical protein C8R45DRAFT_1106738 [Mycena sanguinolenta]|nr:hypothetical protein C8R45DRAFT_1106738 [Mycena sanguinolenta]
MIHTPIAAFQVAPKLKHVCLDGYLRPSHFILPWAQFTGIELTAARGEDCLECLRQAPRLISCSFGIHEREGHSGSLRPVPPHRRIAFLALSGASPTAILPFITMPALEELDVVGRSLELAATGASTIRTLFSSLYRYGEPFLPFLQSLSLSHHTISDNNIPVMFEDMTGLLVRRSAATWEHVQLQSFSLTIEHEQTAPPSPIIQKLRELAERGMDLNIRSRRERWI